MIATYLMAIPVILSMLVGSPVTEDIPPYTISGNSVFMNDSRAFINITPHTLVGSGWITIEFYSKSYTGNVNVVFAYNGTIVTPKRLELWDPHLEEREVCNIDPPFDCFTEEYTENWRKVNRDIVTINHNFDGKDTWKGIPNIGIQANVPIKARIWINMPNLAFDELQYWDSKYGFGFYPSGYGTDIPGALANDHLPYIDPWGYGTTGLVSFYSLDNASTYAPTMVADLHGSNHANNTGTGSIENYTGYIVDAFNNTPGAYMTSDSPINPSAWTFHAWIYPATTLNDNGLLGLYDNSNHDLFIDWSQAHPNNFRLYYDGGWRDDADGLSNWTTGKWQLLSVTYEQGNITLFKDGIQTESYTGLSDMPAWAGDPMKFFTRGDSFTTRNFEGLVDHIAFFNVKHTPTEVVEWNSSLLSYPFGAGASDTCTYGDSGDWIVYFGDNCTINGETVGDGSSEMKLGGGCGNFTCTDSILNFSQIELNDSPCYTFAMNNCQFT